MAPTWCVNTRNNIIVLADCKRGGPGSGVRLYVKSWGEEAEQENTGRGLTPGDCLPGQSTGHAFDGATGPRHWSDCGQVVMPTLICWNICQFIGSGSNHFYRLLPVDFTEIGSFDHVLSFQNSFPASLTGETLINSKILSTQVLSKPNLSSIESKSHSDHGGTPMPYLWINLLRMALHMLKDQPASCHL